jgi:hypothetical protein
MDCAQRATRWEVGARCPAAWTLAVLAAALCGCGDRPYQDGLDLPPGDRTSRFIASGPLTPESAVLVLAQVPPLRYTGGVIEITGGSEMMVVQPQAWREYTGTALSVEEASRELSRARRLESTWQALGVSADELLEILHQRLDTPTLPPPSPPAPAAAPMHTQADPNPHARTTLRARPPLRIMDAPAGHRADLAHRDLELRRISDAALTQLQEVLLQAACEQAQAEGRCQELAAITAADALAQQDRNDDSQAATRVASTGRPASYQAQLQAAQLRDHDQQQRSQSDDAARREQALHLELATRQEATRLRIEAIHEHAAQALQQCCESSDTVTQTQPPRDGLLTSTTVAPVGAARE